jgi:hypothetical protein
VMDQHRGRRIVMNAYQVLVDRPDSTLTDDERRSKGFLLADRALLAGIPVTGQKGAWVRHLQEYESIRDGQWWPRQNARRPETHSTRERELAEWFRRQRRAARDGRLCSYQLERLQNLHIPFALSHSDYLWGIKLQTYRLFLKRRHALPRQTAELNPIEASIARWAARQRYLYRKGRLPEERAAALEALPIWSWGRAVPADAARRPTRTPNANVWFPLHPRACTEWHIEDERHDCIAANIARRTMKEPLSCRVEAPSRMKRGLEHG